MKMITTIQLLSEVHHNEQMAVECSDCTNFYSTSTDNPHGVESVFLSLNDIMNDAM